MINNQSDAIMKIDSVILEKIKNKDKQTLKLIFEEHINLVYKIVINVIKNRDYNDDITQEIFLRIYQKIHTFNGKSKLSTWIYKVAYNYCLDYKQRIRRNPIANSETLESWFDCADKEINPATTYAKKSRDEMLFTLIDKLPEKYRSVINLYYFKETDYNDIAEILNIPVGTVKTYLFRAKENLRKLYKKMEKKNERLRRN